MSSEYGKKKTQRADVNAIDGRSLMKRAVITINYLYASGKKNPRVKSIKCI
jgi:hypothetical protein